MNAPDTPTRVGRYEVISHLATGGMAQIYLARMAGAGAFERHVVLKTILPERASDHRFVTMFLDEAKLAATLNHQNIAQVYDVDQSDGSYFMAMEYVHGENVRAILETSLRRSWTIPFELATHIVSGAAAGLHHAHERRGRNGQPLNIVHRDVSPANIMVGFDGGVKVLDFGIAKAEERSTKTVGNTIKGKYGYMSPEQCKGQNLDRRSDIFALGIVLYELTTLRRAFKGNDDFDTMKKIVGGELPRPSRVVANYPIELESIVMTALATKVEQRFQTALEMIEAIDAYAQRAKSSGSASTMARFMVQLFGEKAEPWVTGRAASEIDDDENAEIVDDQPTTVTGAFEPSVQPAAMTMPMAPQGGGRQVSPLLTPSPHGSGNNLQPPVVPAGANYGRESYRNDSDDAAQSAVMTNSWRPETEEQQTADSWATYDSTTAQRHESRARVSTPRITPAPPTALGVPAAQPPLAPQAPPIGNAQYGQRPSVPNFPPRTMTPPGMIGYQPGQTPFAPPAPIPPAGPSGYEPRRTAQGPGVSSPTSLGFVPSADRPGYPGTASHPSLAPMQRAPQTIAPAVPGDGTSIRPSNKGLIITLAIVGVAMVAALVAVLTS